MCEHFKIQTKVYSLHIFCCCCFVSKKIFPGINVRSSDGFKFVYALSENSENGKLLGNSTVIKSLKVSDSIPISGY